MTQGAPAPPTPQPAKQRSLVQPHRARGGNTLRGANAIQLHPLAIKVPKFKEWRRDTGEINLQDDISLFKTKVRDDNPKITSIEVRKKSTQDHQVVVVGMEGNQFMQMDLSSAGSMLRYDIDQDHYSVVVGRFAPNPSLRLDDVFNAFYNLSHKKGFDFDEYNCMKFANDLAMSIGKAQRDESNSDFDAFF